MRGASLVVAALLAAPLAAGQTAAPKDYITPDDTLQVAKADAAVTKFCSVVPGEGAKDAADAKANLEDAVGDRPIYQAMKDSESSSEFGTKMEDIIAEYLMSGLAVPIFLSVISSLLCYCFVCTTNPLMKNLGCCRPCRAVRENGLPHKACAVLPVALAFLMTVVGMATASGGSSTMVAGFDNLACESAILLNSTLQGKGGTLSFIGLIPALETMKGVEDVLNAGSPFLTQLDAALADTQIVSDAIAIATSALDTMGEVLDATATEVQTTTVTGFAKTYRTCEFCTTLKGVLDNAATGLKSGVGQALANARNEVKAQLGPTKRAEIQKLVRSSAQPMISMKESFINAVGGILDQSDDGLKMLQDNVPSAVTMVFLGAFVVTLCGCCSTTWCALKEKTGDGAYSKGPHRLACCTFFFAFPFAIFCFILGGILSSVTVPLADVCLIMDDLDGAMVKEIAPALGDSFDPNSEEGKSLVTMLDNCINPANKSLNAAFLDLINITNETSGTSQTMGQMLKDTITAPINSQFSAIGSADAGASLATSDSVVQLLASINNNPIQKVIVVNPDTTSGMPSDTDYSPLSGSTVQAIKDGFGTTLSCNPHTMDVSGTSTTLPGMKTFVDALTTTYTTGTGTLETICTNNDWRPRSCPGDTVNGPICTAGNKYMDLYKNLVAKATYRCDVWEKDDMTSCDVYDMTSMGGNSCIRADGTMKKKQVLCNWMDFKTYYGKSSQRIQRAFEYVDYAVAQKQSGISTTLKNLVFEFFINPMFSIFDGLTCGFMPAFWQEVVNSLCFQGVYGVRRIGQGYTMSAFFIMILGISMYVVWRRTIDNVNCSQEGAAPGEEAAV